jgi:hypothetical protein
MSPSSATPRASTPAEDEIDDEDDSAMGGRASCEAAVQRYQLRLVASGRIARKLRDEGKGRLARLSQPASASFLTGEERETRILNSPFRVI